MPKILSLITARGGSKSILRKNIIPVAGKPMIAWTINAAKKCSKINRIIVSTDDDEIAQICKKFNVEIPFKRPEKLAQDHSSHIDVVIHAIEWMRTNSYCEDYIMLLQPTSPLRTSYDIEAAINILETKNANCVISVCEIPFHINKVAHISKHGNLIALEKENKHYTPRQSLQKQYHENGAIYLIKTKTLLEQRTWYPDQTFPYIMPQERSIDIDKPWDIYLADLILHNKIYNRTATISKN